MQLGVGKRTFLVGSRNGHLPGYGATDPEAPRSPRRKEPRSWPRVGTP